MFVIYKNGNPVVCPENSWNVNIYHYLKFAFLNVKCGKKPLLKDEEISPLGYKFYNTDLMPRLCDMATYYKNETERLFHDKRDEKDIQSN